jgi:hypothetical protein
MDSVNFRENLAIQLFQTGTQQRLDSQSGLSKRLFSATVFTLFADGEDLQNLGSALANGRNQ